MLASPIKSQTAVVLIVDPEPANQRKLRDQLMRLGYTARSADNYESAANILEATPPDVVLLTGLADDEAGWGQMQEQLKNWGIPVVKLVENPPGKARVLEEVMPDLSDREVKLRLDEALRSRRLHEMLIMENARLAAERMYDPLTGIFNRRYIMIRVEEEIKRSARHKYPLACLILDIDSFEAINEEWGHPVGDSVLKEMAHVVTRTLRATDIVARYREDEFIALLTDTNAEGAQVAANRLRDAVQANDFINPASQEPLKLTVSVGVSYWLPSTRPGEGTWEPQLLALAERALRAAKLSGPNRLVMLQAS